MRSGFKSERMHSWATRPFLLFLLLNNCSEFCVHLQPEFRSGWPSVALPLIERFVLMMRERL